MHHTDHFERFEKNYTEGKTQLVWQWIAADLETPVSAYLKLCGNDPYSFLLESVEGGVVLGRYSVIGMSPDLVWRCDQGEAKIWHDYGSWEQENAPPLESLRELLKSCRIDDVPTDLPPMAVSGLFGYLGYDMIRLVENIPDKNDDDLKIPESILSRPTILAIFDNVKNMICVVTPVYNHAKNSASRAHESWTAALERLETSIEKLESPLPSELTQRTTSLRTPLDVSTTMEADDYKSAVKKAIEYIHQGEIFQSVLARRFSIDFDLPSFDLYRSLRRLNPSPFMFHLQFEDFSLVGSSPEILVRVRGGNVTIRPIAGTRKRGKTPEEDKNLAEDLLNDPKERAEHLMLLDLGRNDVGRVSEYGSVKVTERFVIEHYSHVMHIVSNVEGKLKENFDTIDALFAGFPAGTVSGAPKVRAMEIIDELETTRRGYYGGCAGYFSGNGEMDTCILLRTALVRNGKINVQAGAGVVADSDPESELQETTNKAQAVIRAAEMAIEESSKKSQRKQAAASSKHR